MAKKKGGAIVDFGNVIIDHLMGGTTDQNFRKINYNTIPEVKHAFSGLLMLHQAFDGNVTVVYNATRFADKKIIAWCEYHQFTLRTGIPLKRVIRTTNGRDKTPFMRQRSRGYEGTTLVIDDRLEVMTHFDSSVVPHLLLFRPQIIEVNEWRHMREIAPLTAPQSLVKVAWTWDEIMNYVSQRIQQRGSVGSAP